jgi:Tol biopolymer transport system component
MRSLIVLGAAALAFAQPPATNPFDLRGDLGVTPKPGSIEFDAAKGEYKITGGGASLWGAADAGHFTWKRLSGDVTLTADVRFIGTGVNPHRKAVLMVRQALTPDSPYADVALHGDGSTALQYRLAAGGVTAEVKSSVTSPTRIRIQRRGNVFTMFAGKPGGELVAADPMTVPLTDPVYVGLGVCAHDANVLETAVFSNVTLQQPQPQQRYRSKITVYDFGTKKSETLHTADQVIEAPNWSRDGKYLLVNTNGNLYKLPVGVPDPKLEKLQMGDGGWRANNDHDFTRDGKLLAFSASSPNSRQSQVWVAEADGSKARLMTPLAPSYFHGWSPDGKFLAFVGQREGKFTLWRVPVEGGPEQRLTWKGYDDGPEYTPDGKWIYFNSNRNGGWDIWRIPVGGAGPDDAKAERVTSDEVEDWFPHFSPDGKRMLVFGFPKGTDNHNGKMEGVVLRIMNTPGKTLKPAKLETVVTFFGGQGTINVNSWSPDSKKFAYVVYEKLP